WSLRLPTPAPRPRLPTQPIALRPLRPTLSRPPRSLPSTARMPQSALLFPLVTQTETGAWGRQQFHPIRADIPDSNLLVRAEAVARHYPETPLPKATP